MSSILIIADGNISKKFIETIELKNLNEHHYTVVVKDKKEFKDSKRVEYVELDATSLYRLKSVCKKDKYSVVFIVDEDSQEAYVIYSNIRKLNKKVRVVALDNRDIFKDVQDSYLNIVDINIIIANRLYDYLPNVPVTAQTIGLNQGEIMEVLVPFSSPYAYRHIGSIPQVKWRIAAVYRDEKLIIPTHATMIKPRDRLLIVGKPKVLADVYKKITRSSGTFPEPFGKNFYLLLDLDIDSKKAIDYIKDAISLLDKFKDKKLIIRVVNPNNTDVLDRVLEFDKNSNIRSYITYQDMDYSGLIASDIESENIGLIMASLSSLQKSSFAKDLYIYKKLIYIFGTTKILNIKEAAVVKSDSAALEEISSIAFYIADTLDIKLSLREYNPQGNFSDSSSVIEHYETLAHVHNSKVEIIQEKKNPIKAIKDVEKILLIIPFNKSMDLNNPLSFLKRDVYTLLIKTNSHPKLLIPIEE